MKLKKLIYLIEKGTIVTLCYAGNGHRLYQGEVENIPTHLLNYYIVLLLPSGTKLYIEIHESDIFAEVEKEWFLKELDI